MRRTPAALISYLIQRTTVGRKHSKLSKRTERCAPGNELHFSDSEPASVQNGLPARRRKQTAPEEVEMYFQQNKHEGCSKRSSNKAAGSGATEAYPLGTSQGALRPRTPLGSVFSILTPSARSSQRTCEKAFVLERPSPPSADTSGRSPGSAASGPSVPPSSPVQPWSPCKSP